MSNNLYRNQNLAMTNLRQKELAESFSDWEIAGRGWQIFTELTELELLFGRFTLSQKVARPTDDGRIPGLFGHLFSKTQNQNQISTSEVLPLNNFPNTTPSTVSPQKLTSFRLYFPRELKISFEQTEQILNTLILTASLLSFEIIGSKEEINFQITCPELEKSAVLAQLKSYLPILEIREDVDLLVQNFQINERTEVLTVDFGLGKEWFIPLPFGKRLSTDSLLPLIASMEELIEDEIICLQILFSQARGDWQNAAQEVIFDCQGKPVFANLTNYLSGIKEKFTDSLFAVVIRLLVKSCSNQKSLQMVRRTKAFFYQFSLPSRNELIPLRNDGLSIENHLQSFLNRTSYRKGMLLTARELSSIVHLPSDSVLSPKIKRNENLSKSAPDFVTQGNLTLGENLHAGAVKKVFLSSAQRIKHTHLIGSSGSGKSTLLMQMMNQDLELGNGFACFDPHGDLIDAVLERVPESRFKDVIIFDPADEDFPIGFNILSAHSELEKTLLASDLVSIFRRFSTSWGDVMNSILANAVLAFLESKREGTLLDLKRFLIERNFREEFLQTVMDEEIRYYWQVEFPNIKGKPFAPLLTRLDTFLRSKLIRYIVAQKENKLDFRRMMDEQKILLVRLSLGAIGEENAYLLGSLLVAKFYHATLSRQNVAEENRLPFFLYLDEAHHFITESMNQILSGVRKYKLGLVLAHQQLHQFQSGEADILASVLANCYTRICFRLDDADAERLAKGFSFFTSEHLKNLGVGKAIARFEQSQFDFNLKTFPLEKVPSEIASQRRRKIIDQTRRNYAKPKAQIETEVQNSRQTVNNAQGESLQSNYQIQIDTPQPEVSQIVVKQTKTPLQPHSVNNSLQEIKGKGGKHHQDLQSAIKRMAETYGFSVELEKGVLEGSGNIDVSLQKENLKIACEVSVTTTDYEINNVSKCLASGYDFVIVICSQTKKIPLLQRKIYDEVSFSQKEQVKVLSLPNFFSFLHEITLPKDAPTKKEKPQGQRISFVEACEFLGVGSSTLYRWIREGRVPFYRIGREYQFDREELVLIGRHDLSGKRKALVKLEPLQIEKTAPKTKKEQDARYRKLLNLE